MNRYLIPHQELDASEETNIRLTICRMRKEGAGLSVKTREYATSLGDSLFETTRYWKAIMKMALKGERSHCAACGDYINLNVLYHDKKLHGMELFHPENIYCLCDRCCPPERRNNRPPLLGWGIPEAK